MAPRRRCGAREKAKLLDWFNDACAYCEVPFDSFTIDRRGKIRGPTKPHWDHLRPYAYTLKNDKFVPACQLCNLIKSCNVYDTFEDAQAFVLSELKRRKVRRVD